MATAIHGRNASVYVEDSSGASQSVSGDLNSANLEISAEAPDVTGFGNDTAQLLSNGLKSWSLSVEGFYKTGAAAAASTLFGILSSSTYIQFGTTGSTSGCPKFTGCAVMTSLSFEFGVNDAATMSAEFQSRSGSLTASSW